MKKRHQGQGSSSTVKQRPEDTSPSQARRTALSVLSHTPDKPPTSTTPRNRSSLETLQRFCRHAIKPISKQAYHNTVTDNNKQLYSPPPAPPVSSLSYTPLGTALQIHMSQSLNNLPTKLTAKSEDNYHYIHKRRALQSARPPPKVKPFTPSAKHRLRLSIRHSINSDLYVQQAFMDQSASVLSSRAMTRLLCDKTVPTETQYQKYMTHLNKRSQNTLMKYSRHANDTNEVAIAGGFRLTAGQPKAYQVFQYC